MLNNRNEKDEGQEEGEYHFSDDETNYEVDAEPSKPVSSSKVKEGIINQLTRSKRMVISLIVFLALVFVVYKLVAPTSVTQTPSEAITPVAEQKPPVAENSLAQQPPLPAVTTTTSTATVANGQMIAPTPQAEPLSTPPPVQMQQPMQQAMGGSAPQQQPPSTGMNVVGVATTPQQTMQTVNQTPGQTYSNQTMQQAPVSSTPVVTVVPSQNTMNGSPMVIGLPASVEAKAASMASSNQQMANQLQTDYMQKLNDFVIQNKALQDQLQTLNTRVASMEAQINQLTQTIIRQNQQSTGGGGGSSNNSSQEEAAPGPKIAYSVQAIIPGRAWLRSDSGETLTVAEGDAIRGVGRVTKIDPYDGIVEINTGNRVVSLSYGAQG